MFIHAYCVYGYIFVNHVLHVDGGPVLVRPCAFTMSHLIIFLISHVIITMSSLQRHVILFCPNPFCPRFDKAFTNKSGQTCHFITSPGCFQKKLAFATGTADQALLPPPRGSHGICLPNDGQLSRTIYEDTDVIFRSNKRPALLCHNIVNDSVLCARILEGKESGSEEKCSSAFEFDHDDEDEDFAPARFMEEDDDECIGHDPELAFKRKEFHVTTEKKWTVSLLQILDHMNAPDYAYGSIMKWAHDAAADGYDFCPRGGFDRSMSVDYLMNSVLNGKLLLPYIRTVDLPHGGTTEQPATLDVVCFDFVPQLLTLLQNRDIMIAENLATDIEDPLTPYTGPNDTLDEALSGSVFCEAYD